MHVFVYKSTLAIPNLKDQKPLRSQTKWCVNNHYKNPDSIVIGIKWWGKSYNITIKGTFSQVRFTRYNFIKF